MRQLGARIRYGLLAGIVVTAAALGFAVWPNRSTPQPDPAPVRLTVAVDVQSEAVFFSLTDEGEPLPPGLSVRLTLATPAGPLVSETVTTGEATRLTVPYVRAGRTPYRLSVGEVALSGSFSKDPGPPVTPLTLNIGARAARVTGDRDPALIVHPLDAQENVSGVPVRASAVYPGGGSWERVLEVDHLLAWTFVPTGTEVGTLSVSAVADDARAERGEVDLLPGEVSAATLTSVVSRALASGRDVWQLRLTGAGDTFGNRVSDGTAVQFLGGGEGRDLYLTRPLVQGAQSLVLPTYPAAGTYTLSAQAGDYRSEALPLEAEPLDVAEMPLAWRSLTPPVLELGPVLDTSGALIDDGTPVRLSFHGPAGTLAEFSAPLQNGMVRWTLPPRPEGATVLAAQVGRHFDYLPVHAFALGEAQLQ